MPVEVLDCVEHTAHLDPLELGALLALCRAFWAGGARPMPPHDVDLMRLSGCDLRRWRMVREKVLEAFEALKPSLMSVYGQSAQAAATRLAVATKASAAAHAKNRQRDSQQSSGVPLTDIAVSGPLSPATKNDSVVNVFDRVGDAIPRRVNRSAFRAALADNG